VEQTEEREPAEGEKKRGLREGGGGDVGAEGAEGNRRDFF